MKVSGLGALVCAETVAAAAILGGASNFLEKRQLAGILGALGSGDTAILGALGNGNYGRKMNHPAGAAKVRQEMKSDLPVPGAKRVKLRYGPYTVPSMNRQNKFSKHWGMLESHYDTAIDKPCAGPCNILKQFGGLEYADGKNANIDTGLWLHHMVHFNTGPGRWDPVGISQASCIPHEGVNTMGGAKLGRGTINAKNTERYFVTGNERTPFHYWNGKNTAYHLQAQDKFFFLVELMNMNMKDETVYITMTYDYLDGPLPSGWSDVKSVFLDANSCGSSEVPSPKGKTAFTIQSKPYKPNIEGPIIDSIGHLHDGGIDIDIIASGASALCKSNAKYSGKPEFVYKDTGMEMHGDKVAKDHISHMDGCGPKDAKVKTMSKGQSWVTKGIYDYNKRSANLEHGQPSDVMAIAVVLVATKQGQKPV